MKTMIQCFVILGFATCVNAQAVPCPETPSPAMEAEVTTVFSAVKNVQAQRVTNLLERYAQILGPLTNRDGTVALPHGLRMPTDRTESPGDLGFNANVLLGYSLDEYEGPLGIGYFVHATFERNTNVCRATIELGPNEKQFPDATTFTTPEWYLVEETQ